MNVIKKFETSAYAFAVLVGANFDGYCTNFEIWAVEAEQIPQGTVLSLNKA
jgi:hypothetical protein